MAVKKTKKKSTTEDDIDGSSLGFADETIVMVPDEIRPDDPDFDESKIQEGAEDDTTTYTMGDIQVEGAGEEDAEEFKKASKAITKEADQDEDDDEEWSAEDFSIDDKDDFLAMEDYDLDNPEDDNY